MGEGGSRAGDLDAEWHREWNGLDDGQVRVEDVHRIAALGMSGGEAMLSAAALIPISLFLGHVMLETRNIIAPGLLHTAINWLEL